MDQGDEFIQTPPGRETKAIVAYVFLCIGGFFVAIALMASAYLVIKGKCRCCKKKKRKPKDTLAKKYKVDHENFMKGTFGVNTVDAKVQNSNVKPANVHSTSGHVHPGGRTGPKTGSKKGGVRTTSTMPNKTAHKARSIDNAYIYTLERNRHQQKHKKPQIQKQHIPNVTHKQDKSNLVTLFPYKYIDESGTTYIVLDPTQKAASVPNVRAETRSLDHVNLYNQNVHKPPKAASHANYLVASTEAEQRITKHVADAHHATDYLPHLGFVAMATCPRKPAQRISGDFTSVLSGTTMGSANEFQEIAVYMSGSPKTNRKLNPLIVPNSNSHKTEVDGKVAELDGKGTHKATSGYIAKTFVSQKESFTQQSSTKTTVANGSAFRDADVKL